jgi:hypothetical protein
VLTRRGGWKNQASSTRNRRLHKRSIQLCLPELLHNLATSLARGGLYNEAIPFFRQQLVLVSEVKSPASSPFSFVHFHCVLSVLEPTLWKLPLPI